MKNESFEFLSKNMMMARKSQIHHLLEMGILFQAFYDTETTDLNKRFAEITQFGGVVTDIAGNILHTVDLHGKISPYTVVSPYAWLVQRMRLEDVEKGDSRYIFTGKMLQFFRHVSNLDQAPYSRSFLGICREGTYRREGREPEKYFSYPVLNDDLTVDWDYVRIHESLKKFYFKRPETGQWIKRDIKAMTIGYNNVNADDQWIWSASHMAAADSIFPTHLAQMGKFRLDGLRVIEAAVIAGQGGENGIRAAIRKNPRTNEEYYSFSQGAILEANTRLGSEVRGILDGVTLPDGSHPDLSQLHGALPDALALSALMRLVRDREPDILRQMEINAEWKGVVDRLTEIRGGFGNNPIMAYVDKSFPVVDGKMVTLIGTDQYRNNPKVALVYNLGIDPKTYRYNGKGLEDLTEHEWAQIIRAAKTNPNAPVKVIKTHHSPRLFGAEVGYEKGFHLGADRSELAARVRYLVRADIAEKAMAGLRAAYPRLHGPERLTLPQPEEELFTFSTLELHDEVSGDDVQVNYRLQNKVEEIAQKSRAHAMKIKGLWLEAMQPDEDIILNESGSAENAKSFVDKISELNKKLKKERGPQIPPPDSSVQNYKDALIYKLKILFYARNLFLSGELQDIGHHFWFEDSDGLKIPEEEVAAWAPSRIDEAYKSGNLNIHHEQTKTMVLVIDRIIEDLGYRNILGADVCDQLDAYKLLRQSGMPQNQGQEDRWYTVPRGYRDLNSILGNEVQGEALQAIENLIPGAWEIFMTQNHDAISALGDYQKYLAGFSVKEMSPRQKVLVGINPRTGYPRKNRDYEVDLETAVIVDVPDRYLENPPMDPVRKRALFVLEATEEFNKSTINSGKDIVLRAKATGKMWHLPHAKEVDVPSQSGIYAEFSKAASARYAESGVVYRPSDKTIALIGNGPYPIFDLMGPDIESQSLKIPKQIFEGILSAKLASYRKKPKGVILRDDALRVEKGKICLVETDGQESSPTGWMIEARVSGVSKVGLSDIETMPEKELSAFGYSNREEAVDHLTSLFTTQQMDPRDPKNKALSVMFNRIGNNQRGIFYYNPTQEVVSCLKINCLDLAHNQNPERKI